MPNDDAMYNHVMHLLKTALPSDYHYHDYQHTLYVWHKAIEIAGHEKCPPQEIALLKAAALWHDTGFVNTHKNHEEEGCRMATAYLTAHNFSSLYIETVCGMIMATKSPQSPKNKLEEIIADADLEYLGTGYAALIAGSLFKELQELNPALTKKQWNQMQVAYLQQHQYFTNYCRQNKEPLKKIYLQNLIELL